MSFLMSSVQKIFITSLIFLVLSACGLKGDLYLPEAQPQVVDTPTEIVESIPENASSETQKALDEQTKEESPTP